jgi:hypothetical protein
MLNFLYIFLFQFANLCRRFEIYQNYTTTAVGHGGVRLNVVAYGG